MRKLDITVLDKVNVKEVLKEELLLVEAYNFETADGVTLGACEDKVAIARANKKTCKRENRDFAIHATVEKTHKAYANIIKENTIGDDAWRKEQEKAFQEGFEDIFDSVNTYEFVKID